jgi:putative ABC transport system permease protein
MPLAYNSELYRIPFVITGATDVFACIVIIAAALLSGFTVRQRLAHLDLIAVLKTRE